MSKLFTFIIPILALCSSISFAKAGPRWPFKENMTQAELSCFYENVVFKGMERENAALTCFGLSDSERECVNAKREEGKFISTAYKLCGIQRPSDFFNYTGF